MNIRISKFLLSMILVSCKVDSNVYALPANDSSYKILSMPIVAPCITQIKIEECGEQLVDLIAIRNQRIVPLINFDARYNAGHSDFGKVRKGLYERLLRLLSYLPDNVGLAVFEGYRPLWKQKEYFEKKFKELVQQSADKNLDAIYNETCKFVSPYIDNIPVHCTGAAIDFMLFYINQDGSTALLDLGKFGVIFGPNDQTQTLAANITDEQRKNRLMLLEAAAKAGLVNYGYEWWHFSYGDRAWAYVEKQEKAMYGLVQEKDTTLPLCKNDFFKSVRSTQS